MDLLKGDEGKALRVRLRHIQFIELYVVLAELLFVRGSHGGICRHSICPRHP